ncbi:MAG: glucoamylase family protein [Aureliella sp.]
MHPISVDYVYRQLIHLCLALVLVSSSSDAQDIVASDPPPEVIGDAHPDRDGLSNVITAGDEKLLSQIQHGCHNYFWNEVGTAKIARDRKKAPVSSIAAVGFQLAALPIAVERGWVSHDEAEKRGEAVLRRLIARKDNKRFGLYFHYLDLDTAGKSDSGYEVLVSTVDSAILFAGAIVAGEYFGGPVKQLAREMTSNANWSAFTTGHDGEIAMGWRPSDRRNPTGPGEFHSHHWKIASDEERLVYFLAAGAAEDHAVAPEQYYKLKRVVKHHAELPPFVVSPQGALFQHFFSHCWIAYNELGPDNPNKFGITAPRVDWFENSRRAALTHRRRCKDVSDRLSTLSGDAWGLSACVSRDGYLVPHVMPNLVDNDKWGHGTLATYAAASSIMFTPRESMQALREFSTLKVAGNPVLVSPESGGYGLVDSYNVDQQWICDDWVGIDVGPTMVGIENARTGLIWRLFMQSDVAQGAVRRLKLD